MSIEDRVGRLEQQNRRLRAVVAALGACLALVVGVGAADRLRDALYIEDVTGKSQIGLLTHPQFGTAIILWDAAGCERLRIGSAHANGGEPFIEFFGPGPAPGQRGPGERRITGRP